VSEGNLEVIDEVFDPDVILHSPFPGLPAGAAGLKEGVALLRQVFPNFRLAEDDLIAEEHKVVARCTASGTHEGEFMGAPLPAKGSEAKRS
jgi:predicted ester cyclase